MTTELYKDLSCKSWILVSKSSYEFIFNNFELTEIEKLSWEKAIDKSIKYYTKFVKEAIRKDDFKKEFKKRKDYALIVSELNEKWIIILSDCFNDKDIAYQYCKEISNSKNQVYNFYMDYHFGYDRWIIINEAKIQKICVRNDNDELRIIGQLSNQEEVVLKNKGSYYDLTDIIRLYVPIIDSISYEEIKSKTAYYGLIQSRTKNLIKKEYNLKGEVRYLNPLMNPEIETEIELRVNKNMIDDDDDLPF